MSLENISFVFCTCDRYDDIWNLFFKRLKRFWPEMTCPVYFCTEQKEFSFDGYDIRCPLAKVTEPKENWSERLILLLKQIPDDYILFSLDDFVLTQSVDNNVIEKSIGLMRGDANIGFICLHQELTANSSESRKKNALPAEIPELHLCKRGLPFRITTQTGVWRKSYLLKLLKKHENAWQFEVRANHRANIYYNRMKIYDVNDPVVVYPSGGVLWKGKVLEDHISLFEPEEIQPVIEKRGIITRDEHGKRIVSRKKTIKDYWNFIQSYLPF